ncbi:MAG: dienelactone hydrolase family protein [Devosia sp.]|nr:dienelactone hydrolase family protein [Devosia sp.]
MPISRERLSELFGMREPALELVASIREPQGDYVLETLAFEMHGVGPVRGFLTRPAQATGRLPALLYAHSHGGEYGIGARELLDGRTYLLDPLGPVFARAGYVTLCIDMPTFGDRSNVTESAATKALIWHGKSLIGQMLGEQAAALSYLRGRDDVDAARVGMFGISLGSTLAYWLAAVDPRLAAIAHLCCYADYETLIELGAHDGHGIYLLVPGLLNETSTGEIAGLVAPRPQLICVGDDDALTPPLSVDRALPATRLGYAQAGADDALQVYRQPGVRHQETPEMRQRVLGFFARTL